PGRCAPSGRDHGAVPAAGGPALTPPPGVSPGAIPRSTLNRLGRQRHRGHPPPARAGDRPNISGGAQVLDPLPPPMAHRPAEAVELVAQAVSGGDLETALAQYEAGAVLWPWARDRGGETDGVADALVWLINLRLPLSARIGAVVPGDGLALVLGERRIAGT